VLREDPGRVRHRVRHRRADRRPRPLDPAGGHADQPVGPPVGGPGRGPLMTAAPDQTEVARTGPDRFRQVLGHCGTGITVITTIDDEGPAGFTCQSFAALSLEPPLVLFCPAKTSGTWPRIERAGRFCANVLAGSQRDLARQFASKTPDKFAGVSWSPVPSRPPASGPSAPGPGEQSRPGQRPPLLTGALAWVDAAVETVYDA